jgi:membrane fusion protein (multidrug efflux system)
MDSQRGYPGRGLPTAMLLAVALGACSNAQTPAPAPQLPEVSVVTVHRGSVPITTELPGRTSAFLVAQVRARVDGIVLKREFKEGSEVKMGQRLYQIDPAPYIPALNSAQASVGCRDGKVRSADGLVDLLDAY